MTYVPTESREPGKCPVCDEPYCDVRRGWPNDHPLRGEGQKFGPMHDDAVRLQVTMVDGSQTTITVHDRCVEDLEANLPQFWKEVCHRYNRERKLHRSLGAKDFTPEQNAHADETQLSYIDNKPLGVLSMEAWSDYARRTNP